MIGYVKKAYQQILTDPTPVLYTAGYLVALVVLCAVVWWIFNALLRRYEKRHHAEPFFEKNRALFALLRRAGHYGILMVVAVTVLRLFQAPIVEKIFYALVILVVASFVKAVGDHLLLYLESTIVARTQTRLDNVVIELMQRFLGVIVYAVAIVLALEVVGLNIMPFVAGAGVVGLAIGFAARDTLSNFIAGILLIMDRPFEVGDRIEVWSAPSNSATWGDVIDIGMRATKIKTTDNIVIVIPNNEIMKRDIINYTTITEEIRVRIPIGIAYDADIQKAKEAIVQVCLEMEWVMREPPPVVVVKSFGDSAVNLEARVWIKDPRRRIHTVSHVTDRVKEVFDREGIEIPYPKRDVYIKTSGA